MKQLLILSALCSLLSAPALAQTKNVTKTISTNGLVENLVVPSGKTLTINAGGSIVNNGTATGFTASAVWGSITGTLSSQTDLQTALDAKLATATAASTYQPLDAGLTALASLADASGVLTNNGSGTLSYTATSTGGNFTSDSGKIAKYSSAGELYASMVFQVSGPGGSGTFPVTAISDTGITITHSSGNFTSLTAASMTGGKYLRLPAIGTEASPATLISNLDTGTVTNTMLAGSIAISKLAITGTPDGTKYLRDDGTWQTVSSGATLGANTFTGIQTLPAGTVSAPALTLGDSGTGLFRSATNEFAITNNGTQRFRTTTTGAVVTGILNVTGTNLYMGTGTNYGLVSDGSTFSSLLANGSSVLGGNNSHGAVSVISVWAFGFSPAVNTTAPDCLMMRDAAAVLQFGRDAASPVAQTIKAHDASGTNIDGASLTISGGTSTGTGDDGDVILRSTMTGSSGSSANTQQTRAQVVARFKNLTEGAATDVVSIALGSGRVTGGTATLTVWASDGTDHQALTSEIRFAAVNKAGTVTATCTQTDGTTAASAGTLTVTYDATTSGNNVILRANATSSLTQTTLRSRIVITALNGDDTQVVSPQ